MEFSVLTNYTLDPRAELHISVYLHLWRSLLCVVKLLTALFVWKNIIVPFWIKVSLGSEEHFSHIQILSENLNSFYFLPYFIKTLNPTMFLSSFLTWKALFSGRYHTWRCHVIFLFYNVFLNLFLGNLLTSERN